MAQVPLREGDVVADVYRVERILGVGGMAAVALASTAERFRVAIKMMLPDVVGQEQVVKRFWREVRTLTQLHSEHTLRIYGSGTHLLRPTPSGPTAAGRLPFMLLEYLQGNVLAAVLKSQGPMPVDVAVEHVMQACHAIAEAHSLGITHRDLKPGNLFLTRRHDGSSSVKVLDFGISKVENPGPVAGETSTLTKTTAVMGSPFYMSPEQMISSKDVDARSDVWALGVTLYELLTKSLPFAAETPEEVCFRILHGEPTPLRKLRPMYPKGLEEAIQRCLQRSPGRRFANVADLATALADFGPSHSKHALSSIYDLVEPSAPRTLPVVELEAGPASEVGGAQQTTVYLQKPKRSGGGALAIGVGLVTFVAGAAVGWVMSLDTDPTAQQAVAAPLPPTPASVSATPKVARAPAPSATSEAAIDLDEPEPAGAARPAPVPAPARSGTWPGPPRPSASAPAPVASPPAVPKTGPTAPPNVEF